MDRVKRNKIIIFIIFIVSLLLYIYIVGSFRVERMIFELNNSKNQEAFLGIGIYSFFTVIDFFFITCILCLLCRFSKRINMYKELIYTFPALSIIIPLVIFIIYGIITTLYSKQYIF